MKKTPMRYLWASWRMKYVQNNTKESGCVFCRLLAEKDGADNLIVMRGKQTFAILNKYPYTSGHLMIAPIEHKASLDELDPGVRAEMMELVTQFSVILRSIYRPEGFNVGINIGEAAGAGVLGHIHIHIVPRWIGDTNFMSTIGQTRVLPETLEETYRRVREGWEKTQSS